MRCERVGKGMRRRAGQMSGVHRSRVGARIARCACVEGAWGKGGGGGGIEYGVTCVGSTSLG